MSPISSAFPSSGLPAAFTSASAGLATGSRQLTEDALQIAAPGNDNLTAPLLDSNQSLQLTQASAEVIGTSNQMLGTLLDVTA
jgi:hypothetical protein